MDWRSAHLGKLWFSRLLGPRSLDERPFGHPRNPWAGFFLTVATLGVFHFYYHAASHAELSQEMGWKNRELPILFAYLGFVVLALVAGPALLYLPWFAAGVLFVWLVTRQFRLMEEARDEMGLQSDTSVQSFLLWLLAGSLILVGPFIAYRILVEEYNRIWRAIAKEGAPDASGNRILQRPRRSRPDSSMPSEKPARDRPVLFSTPTSNGNAAAPAPIAIREAGLSIHAAHAAVDGSPPPEGPGKGSSTHQARPMPRTLRDSGPSASMNNGPAFNIRARARREGR